MLDDAPTPTGCRRTEPQRACAAIVDHLDHITHSGPVSQQFHRATSPPPTRSASAGRTGICFDDAMAESFFGALRNERISRVSYSTREAARRDIRKYIELWFNLKRLHSAVGYRPPREVHAEFEDLRLAA
ncbi:integrase core domain-containing protein [Actinacidiphila oryziradicis]|uniref:Integrase catalytic domain-containing protein n=1 Tax=Actinacidiphila oryziradicis TaxID=2571141 RepID=A0A4U0S0S1_9ACTN|nr:integrase core domain-containing protein [Actinacidiphila oryziradicis]TKA01663.1 hypothetical protein FCI23_40350 [Actinacidiphila oryziradicis]